ISAVFPLVAAESGAYPFIFFAAMMVVDFFIVLFYYPETSGISLEQMQRRLGID
ncbi:MAG: MFS transporter, partial [Acidobacteriota bacterium]|nr:MFS transporter [Acidobacteriota bacterium]